MSLAAHHKITEIAAEYSSTASFFFYNIPVPLKVGQPILVLDALRTNTYKFYFILTAKTLKLAITQAWLFQTLFYPHQRRKNLQSTINFRDLALRPV